MVFIGIAGTMILALLINVFIVFPVDYQNTKAWGTSPTNTAEPKRNLYLRLYPFKGKGGGYIEEAHI